MAGSGNSGLGRRLSRLSANAARRVALGVLAASILAAGWVVPALAQGWWPWGGGGQEERAQPRPPPVPREPIYGDPAAPPEAPPPQGGVYGGRSSICLELEQRLVQEGQRGSNAQNMIPQLEGELREVERAYRSGRQQLDRSDCYEYFLFSKSLRRTRRCVDLAGQVEANRRRMDELESRLQQIQASSGRSYQDEIVRELARNNCGSTYQQQARRQEGGYGFWEDQESSGFGGGSSFGALPYATYRTVCVRLCDGYYFPVSFSTVPNHFPRDEEVCRSRCAAPAALYYHQNPGAGMEQAVAASSNEAYTQLKTAFRYRKEYVEGCSCKATEQQADASGLPQHGAAAGDAGGWVSEEYPAGAPQEPPVFGAPQEELPWATTP